MSRGSNSLTKDPAAKGGHYGAPADTHRGVVERSYSYGLIVIFEDLASHDAYQAGEVHQRFLDEHRSKWTKAVVYDVQTS